MSITERQFGTRSDGAEVIEYTLKNSRGMEVSVLNYGCAIRAIRVFGMDVCLGYDSLEEYLQDDACLGAVPGRVANRIANGRFVLNGQQYQLACNDGRNHLHGGPHGFHRQIRNGKVDESGEALILSRVSPDGEEGYPGELRVTVCYELTEQNALRITFGARADRDTILNLTNHSYFNLNGHESGDVLGHILQIHADAVTETDDSLIPTGKLLPVSGSRFDFRNPRQIREEYDDNFVLDGEGFRRVATLAGNMTGLCMGVYTDQPGLQLYTAQGLSARKGKDGAAYQPCGAVCLETQCFPDAVNHEGFPSVILRADEEFQSVTEYRFG